MRKLTAAFCAVLLFAALSGASCAEQKPDENMPPPTPPATETPAVTPTVSPSIPPESSPVPTPEVTPPEPPRANLVDERVELLTTISRLTTTNIGYQDEITDYQISVRDTFQAFSDHPAVLYAKELGLHLGAPECFAIHIEKDGDEWRLIDDLSALANFYEVWTEERARAYLPLVNDFYKETDFNAFYESNTEYYEDMTEVFLNSPNGDIDFDWFRKYLDDKILTVVLTPSNCYKNYGPHTGDGTCYAILGDGEGLGGAVIHEFCHSFANAIAERWFTENADFRKLCEDSFALREIPGYTTPLIVADEYMTRAYNELYFSEHNNNTYELVRRFEEEKGYGFPFIEQVYAMIDPSYVPFDGDIIKHLFGEYTLGSEQRYDYVGGATTWVPVILENPLTDLSMFKQTQVGNVISTKTGDIVIVNGTNVFIDLGATTYSGQNGYRSYWVLTISD